MWPVSIPLWGSFAIHPYGAMIALGVLCFAYCVQTAAKRARFISIDQLHQLFMGATLAGIFGGRLLHIIGDWYTYASIIDFFKIWEGGLSILGAFIGVVSYALFYLKSHRIPVLPVLDLGALYAPIAMFFGRLGCFFAGCCFGAACDLPWAITYQYPGILAPLGTPLHPTQLYSALFYVLLFIALRYFFTRWCHIPGQLLMIFLFFAPFERFLNDFFRDDRIIGTGSSLIVTHTFSLHQWLALCMLISTGAGFLYLTFRKR